MSFTIDKKISATIQSMIIFIIISLPITYKLTNSILGKLADHYGCPTTLGLIVHAIVFGLIVFGLMLINSA